MIGISPCHQCHKPMEAESNHWLCPECLQALKVKEKKKRIYRKARDISIGFLACVVAGLYAQYYREIENQVLNMNDALITYVKHLVMAVNQAPAFIHGFAVMFFIVLFITKVGRYIMQEDSSDD